MIDIKQIAQSFYSFSVFHNKEPHSHGNINKHANFMRH